MYTLIVLLFIFVGALAITLWGLFGDRSKGRARCPKCLYDVRARPLERRDLVCPECGHGARTERHLYRNHRRWGTVVTGLLLMILSGSPLMFVCGWYYEQTVIKALDDVGGGVVLSKPILPAWLLRSIPAKFQIYCQRVWDVQPQTEVGFNISTKFRHVWNFDMRQLPIKEAYMARLKRLTHVGIIQLEKTQLTDAEAWELQRELPHCEIRLYDDGEISLIEVSDFTATQQIHY